MGRSMLQILNFSGFLSEIGKAVHSFNSVSDVLDVLLVMFIIYGAIKLLRDTKAIQLARGFILFILLCLLVNLLDMQASSYIFSLVFKNIFLVLILLFTPEIRRALENAGRSHVTGLDIFDFRSRAEQDRRRLQDMINAVCRACSELSDKRVGALLVFEKKTSLGEIIAGGTPLDALVTPELIGNIFYPKAPLHDGAAVIRGGRVCAAGCILPLTQNKEVASELGTRHRAAIGMSEQSDSVTVVVSEETGGISVAYKGKLDRSLSDGDLREILTGHFFGTESDRDRRARFKKYLGGRRKNGGR